MGKRRLGALIGAAVLTFAAVGSVAATAPTYTIDVTKDGAPANVPSGGADVTYTITVHNSGTGDFQVVDVTDDDAGCTLSAPTGDDGDGKLEGGASNSGETWTYTCTVTGVLPNTTNHVSVDACHNNSNPCSQDVQRVHGTAQFTVGLAAEPSSGGGDASNQPTQAPTDTAITGTSGPTDSAWFLVVALAVLVGSLFILRPSGARRER